MRMDDAAGVLAQADFFDILDDEQLRMLGFAGDRQYFEADQIIYQAGDVPQGAYVLVSGTVRARHEGTEAGKPYALSQPAACSPPPPSSSHVHAR